MKCNSLQYVITYNLVNFIKEGLLYISKRCPHSTSINVMYRVYINNY